jgi:hypothetical protein
VGLNQLEEQMMSLLEAISPTLRRVGSLPENNHRPFLLKQIAKKADSRFLGRSKFSHDYKLADISKAAGLLATYAGDRNSQPIKYSLLVGIAALCVGWVECMHPGVDVIALVDQERTRQTQLFLDGKFLFSCSSPFIDELRKLRVLQEEIGEVAEAIDELEAAMARQGRKAEAVERCVANLCCELIQVAAVAVAWLEALEAR